MNKIDVAVLRELISYNPDTGTLTWLQRDSSFFHDTTSRTAQSYCDQWNARYAGTVALAKNNGFGLCGSVLTILVKAHRVAWALHYGAWSDQEIDHIDGDFTNNRICNLRSASRGMNNRNRRIQRNNASGHHGVSFDKSKNRWTAYINIDGGRKVLGNFIAKGMAVSTRQAAERESGAFHPNHGRPA